MSFSNKSPKRTSSHFRVVFGFIALSLTAIILLNKTQDRSLVRVELNNGNIARYSFTGSEAEKDVEVFFWYGCPHCLNLEAALLENKVKDKVIRSGYTFTRTPLPANSLWEIHARLFHALEHFDAPDTTHLLVMMELQNKKATTFNEIKIMLQRLHANGKLILADRSITPDHIMNLINDESVTQEINKSKIRARSLGISGVPTLMVDGNKKIKISAGMTHQDAVDLVLMVTDSSR